MYSGSLSSPALSLYSLKPPAAKGMRSAPSPSLHGIRARGNGGGVLTGGGEAQHRRRRGHRRTRWRRRGCGKLREADGLPRATRAACSVREARQRRGVGGAAHCGRRGRRGEALRSREARAEGGGAVLREARRGGAGLARGKRREQARLGRSRGKRMEQGSGGLGRRRLGSPRQRQQAAGSSVDSRAQEVGRPARRQQGPCARTVRLVGPAAAGFAAEEIPRAQAAAAVGAEGPVLATVPAPAMVMAVSAPEARVPEAVTVEQPVVKTAPAPEAEDEEDFLISSSAWMLQRRVKEAEVELSAGVARNRELELEVEASKAELAAARRDVGKLLVEVSEAGKKHGMVVAETDGLRVEIDKMMTVKEAAMSALAAEKNKLEKELDVLKRKVDLIQANKDAAVGIVHEEHAEATKLRAELEKLESYNGEKDRDIGVLKAEVKNKGERINGRTGTSAAASPAEQGAENFGHLAHYVYTDEGDLAAISVVTQKADSEWVLDSGASKHVAGNMREFKSYTQYPLTYQETICTADGTAQPIKGVGTVNCTSTIELSSVLHVPAFPVNLVSLSALIDQQDCRVILDKGMCLIQERQTGRRIGTGIRRRGLWYMDRGVPVSADNTVLVASFGDKEAMAI